MFGVILLLIPSGSWFPLGDRIALYNWVKDMGTQC